MYVQLLLEKCLLLPNTAKPFKTLKVSEFNSPIVEEDFNSGLKFHLDSSLHILSSNSHHAIFLRRERKSYIFRFYLKIICTLDQLEYFPHEFCIQCQAQKSSTLQHYINIRYFSSSTSMTSFLICVSLILPEYSKNE